MEALPLPSDVAEPADRCSGASCGCCTGRGHVAFAAAAVIWKAPATASATAAAGVTESAIPQQLQVGHFRTTQ
jgi:hypothetical protein